MRSHPEFPRTLAHYEGLLTEARAWAAHRQAAFNEIVDMVEQHGGALSGEQRATLWELCTEFTK